jgi:hypothetical protein
MDKKFFDRLYKGYSAESFITGQLFENGFESFRLPADFGIDLVVTNQFKKLDGKELYDSSFPFGFQVKSRRLKHFDISQGPNGRNEYNFYYSLKSDEIRTLKEFSNAAYIFVFILPIASSIENNYAFCIHSNEIDNMIEHGFFVEDRERGGYKLNVCFRTFPQYSREEFISEMFGEKLIDEEGIKYLQKNLPEKFHKNWIAEEGLYLCKNPSSSKRAIVSSYNFSEFPYFSKIDYRK